MDTLQDIQESIRRLSPEELMELERWFYTRAFENEELRVEEPSAAYQTSFPSYLLKVEEYLKREVDTAVRHEYVGGQIFAMSGASREHNQIAGNLFNAFSNHLRGGPCRVFVSDMKVRTRTERDEIFYYPDVVVACGHEGIEKYFLTHPKLIVEVLSPSTQRADRCEKALNYRRMPTLEEYVLVAQDRPEVTIFCRRDDWAPQRIAELAADADFGAIDLSVPLSRIFENVFPVDRP